MSMKETIHNINCSEFRTKQIPMGVVAGWPSIRLYNEKIALTIPYFRRAAHEAGFVLYPISCSLTVLLDNTDKILDYTQYPLDPAWGGVDFSKPVGKFKHEALKDVKTRAEYQALCDELYSYYDEMIDSVKRGEQFASEDKMRVLFSKLMEPSLYPYYLKINKKFYGNFCNQ